MNKENCALKFVDEIILYYDARSKKHQNMGTEYFKPGAHSPFFFSSKHRLFHNVTFFGSCIIHILPTGCAKIKTKTKFRRQRATLLRFHIPNYFQGA